MNTAETLGKEHSVSSRTVIRAGKFADEVARKPELQKAINEKRPVKMVIKETRKAEKKEELERAGRFGQNRRRSGWSRAATSTALGKIYHRPPTKPALKSPSPQGCQLGRRYNRTKKAAHFTEGNNAASKTLDQNDTPFESTAAKLGAQHGVSEAAGATCR